MYSCMNHDTWNLTKNETEWTLTPHEWIFQKCTAFPLTFLFTIFEKPFNCFFFFDIQPEEGPSIRAETSYPIKVASFWVAGRPREKRLADLILKLLEMLAISQFKARFQAQNQF